MAYSLLKYLIYPVLFLMIGLLYRPHCIRKRDFFYKLRALYGAKIGIFHARFGLKGYLFTVSAPAQSPAVSLVKIIVDFPRTLIGSVVFYPKVFGQINLSTFIMGANEAVTLESGGAVFHARTDNTETIQRLKQDQEIWKKLPGVLFQSELSMIKVDARRKRLKLEGLDLAWVMYSPETYFLLRCQIIDTLGPGEVESRA